MQTPSGNWKRVFHWGPLIAIGIIKSVSWAAVHCNSLWWPPRQSFYGFLNSTIFWLLSASTLYNLLYSMYVGPGYLPYNWRPEDEGNCKFLQFCTVCQGYKAPRSHHCRKCKRCIQKMDHHCPWINHCVGHQNHTNFTLFLLSAVCGCAHATVIISCTLYRALNANYYYFHHFDSGDVPLITLGMWTFVFCLFSLGLAVGVVLAVGFLLFIQMKAIVRNRTGIEDWVIEKAAYRREDTDQTFIYPYDLGCWKNTTQVLNWRCQPKGDGILWDVRPDCNQFTFTIEQIEQKKAKRERALDYIIEQDYSGKWFPLSFGWRVCLHPPCNDEPRIVVHKGDKVTVTRWKKYWLYGEVTERADGLQIEPDQRRANRGWFPRNSCVIHTAGAEENVETEPGRELDLEKEASAESNKKDD